MESCDVKKRIATGGASTAGRGTAISAGPMSFPNSDFQSPMARKKLLVLTAAGRTGQSLKSVVIAFQFSEIFLTENIKEGLQCARRTRIDYIIVDAVQASYDPILNIIIEIRTNLNLRLTPIIFLLDSIELDNDILSMACAGIIFLKKPLHGEELFKTLTTTVTPGVLIYP